VLSVPQPQDRPPIFGEEKEGAQPTASELGRTQQEGGGNLVRYNNKVRINFFFETVER
jgi:hypothetical protein